VLVHVEAPSETDGDQDRPGLGQVSRENAARLPWSARTSARPRCLLPSLASTALLADSWSLLDTLVVITESAGSKPSTPASKGPRALCSSGLRSSHVFSTPMIFQSNLVFGECAGISHQCLHFVNRGITCGSSDPRFGYTGGLPCNLRITKDRSRTNSPYLGDATPLWAVLYRASSH
jgi:hypothetical protein